MYMYIHIYIYVYTYIYKVHLHMKFAESWSRSSKAFLTIVCIALKFISLLFFHIWFLNFSHLSFQETIVFLFGLLHLFRILWIVYDLVVWDNAQIRKIVTNTFSSYRRGIEYVDCISCNDGKTPPPTQGCSGHDTRLHLVIRVQFWSSVEYPFILNASWFNQIIR